jgi:hypothetical protein
MPWWYECLTVPSLAYGNTNNLLIVVKDKVELSQQHYGWW